MSEAERAGRTSLWVTLIIVGALFVLGESILVAFAPGSSTLIVQDATVLAGVGVSTFATLKQLLRTNATVHEVKREAEANSAQLQIVGRNVNGNLSELIAFARDAGYPEDKLETALELRMQLERTLETRKGGTIIPVKHSLYE